MPSGSILLSDKDTKDWLRSAAAITEDDVSIINTTIQHHEERLQCLAIQIDSILNPAAPVGERLPGFCGIPFNWRINKLQSGLSELKQLHGSQEASRNSIRNLKSALAPIRRLPPELLSEIFELCLPKAKFIRSSPSKAPLLLTQVCSAWRTICISNASLWSSLEIGKPSDIGPSPPSDTNMKGDITALVNMWFSRASNRPLSFSVQENNLLYQVVPETLERFGRQWQHLKIRVPKDTCMLLQSEIEYQALETFEMQTVEGLEDVVVEELSEAATRAPNLHQFIWDNPARRAARIALPWANLTRLILNTGIDIDQCLLMMSQLSNITHLTFQNIIMSTAMLSNLRVTLPELTSLVICSEFPIGPPLFDELTLPKLKELVLNIRSWPHESITGFLRRSRCPLESLNLYFPPVTELELIECLEIVQNSLKEFTVQGSGGVPSVADTLLDRLTYRGTGNVLCPQVVVIALYECISCSPGCFTDMARSRLAPPSSSGSAGSEVAPRRDLAILRVIEMYDVEAEQLELKPLRGLGLILKLYSMGTQREMQMEPEEVERLRRLREEGLILRVYSSVTGHFGEAD